MALKAGKTAVKKAVKRAAKKPAKKAVRKGSPGNLLARGGGAAPAAGVTFQGWVGGLCGHASPSRRWATGTAAAMSKGGGFAGD